MGSASSTARVSRDPANPAFGCICATMSPASGSPISPLPRSTKAKRWIAWASNRATSPSPIAVIRSLTACAPPATPAPICSFDSTWNSLNLRDGAGEPVDWLALFAKADAAGHFDMPVTVHKARGRFKPLLMRLVITPKPPDIAERARDVARHNARKDQHDVDPRTLRAAGYMILITSLDATAFPPQLLVRLYRVRWQIELAFKRLKSILRLDRLPAKDPGLARAWIAAHLLLALLIEDTTAQMADFSLRILKRPRPPPRPPEPSAGPRALATHLPPGGCPESHHLAGRDVAQIAEMCARKCRQLFERPRRRLLQTVPVPP